MSILFRKIIKKEILQEFYLEEGACTDHPKSDIFNSPYNNYRKKNLCKQTQNFFL